MGWTAFQSQLERMNSKLWTRSPLGISRSPFDPICGFSDPSAGGGGGGGVGDTDAELLSDRADWDWDADVTDEAEVDEAED